MRRWKDIIKFDVKLMSPFIDNHMWQGGLNFKHTRVNCTLADRLENMYSWMFCFRRVQPTRYISTLRIETECISYVEKDARVSLGYPNPNRETTRAVHNAAGGIPRDCIDIKIPGVTVRIDTNEFNNACTWNESPTCGVPHGARMCNKTSCSTLLCEELCKRFT